MLSMDVIQRRAELPVLRARLATMMDESKAATSRVPLPSLHALSEIRRRVGELNSISGVRGWFAPALLAWLEEHMPESVYLLSFQHQLREGEVVLVVESPSTEALTSFLLGLEREPHFKEVLLARQSPRSEVRGTVQFEIRLKERA